MRKRGWRLRLERGFPSKTVLRSIANRVYLATEEQCARPGVEQARWLLRQGAEESIFERSGHYRRDDPGPLVIHLTKNEQRHRRDEICYWRQWPGRFRLD